jgi:hypothetical protein
VRGRVSPTAPAVGAGGPSGPDDPCFDAWRHAAYDPVADGVDDGPDDPDGAAS